MHLEDNPDAELGSLFDDEWLFLQLLKGAGPCEINNDVRASFGLKCERLDNAPPGVIRVSDRRSAVEAKRGFPAVEGLIVRIWRR